MAGVDVGAQGGGKRATNSDINMIPFIDLLMVTIAFLLITAVWVTNSRINLDAQVPGNTTCQDDCLSQTEKVLHLNIGESDFGLTWKQAGTVMSEVHIPKSAIEVGDPGNTAVRYPELAKAIEKEWGERGAHLDPGDKKSDQAVLHADNRTPFKELVAVLDAVGAAKRDRKMPSGKTARVSAFNTTFAVR